MQISRLTGEAERASQRYALLLAGFAGIFARHIQSGADPGSDRARRRAQADGYVLAETYLAEEGTHLRDAIAREREDATRATLTALNLPYEPAGEMAVAHSEAIATDLEFQLRVQLERDIASLTRGMRAAALRARLVARARAVPLRAALVTLAHSGDAPAVQFHYEDRAGRRWPSHKLVRTIWRHALLLDWNETAMLVMAERGITQATIEHPDESHAERGTVISLTEEPTLITWNSVREDVFHPNSNTWLVPSLSQP